MWIYERWNDICRKLKNEYNKWNRDEIQKKKNGNRISWSAREREVYSARAQKKCLCESVFDAVGANHEFQIHANDTHECAVLIIDV